MEPKALAANGNGNTLNTSDEVISSFIADWVQIKYFYSHAAQLAQELCETLLASDGIRAIVTYRVKQDQRLDVKLRERAKKRDYKTHKEIRDDIVDLAGVRIALYFPSDREKIGNIIQKAFTVVKLKHFDHRQLPDPDEVEIEKSENPDFQERFPGYAADHYRVRMRLEQLPTKRLQDDFQKRNPIVEIQVASVLMHAWSEIEHDLVYKTLTGGQPSEQELRILDATNGLVHTGEVLLQQLQTAMDARVKYKKAPFIDHFELLSYLRRKFKNSKWSTEYLDILLLVLQLARLDSPRSLGEMLKDFSISVDSTDPIDLMILDHVLRSLGNNHHELRLHSKLIGSGDMKIDKTNTNCYVTDFETRNKMLRQRSILKTAVSIADILRFPKQSILVVDGLPKPLRGFYTMYNTITSAQTRQSVKNRGKSEWLCDKSFGAMDPLWMWFSGNKDLLFRVSLLLARMDVKEIDRKLMDLRPASGFERLPTMSSIIQRDSVLVNGGKSPPQAPLQEREVISETVIEKRIKLAEPEKDKAPDVDAKKENDDMQDNIEKRDEKEDAKGENFEKNNVEKENGEKENGGKEDSEKKEDGGGSWIDIVTVEQWPGAHGRLYGYEKVKRGPIIGPQEAPRLAEARYETKIVSGRDIRSAENEEIILRIGETRDEIPIRDDRRQGEAGDYIQHQPRPSESIQESVNKEANDSPTPKYPERPTYQKVTIEDITESDTWAATREEPRRRPNTVGPVLRPTTRKEYEPTIHEDTASVPEWGPDDFKAPQRRNTEGVTKTHLTYQTTNLTRHSIQDSNLASRPRLDRDPRRMGLGPRSYSERRLPMAYQRGEKPLYAIIRVTGKTSS